MNRSLSGDPLVRLIEHIYRGAVDPHAWQNVVERFAHFFQCTKGRLFTGLIPPEQGGIGISYGVPESALREWAARYLQHDLWLQLAIQKGLFEEGTAVLDHDLLPEEEFLQSIIYREHLVDLGVSKLCAGAVFDATSPGVLPTVISTYRGPADPPFDESDRAKMTLLVPHLSRALGVMYRLRDAELRVAASFAALDRLKSGIALVGRDGSVLHANREAMHVLEAGDGLVLRAASSRAGAKNLAASDPAAQQDIDRALAAATSSDIMEVAHVSATVLVPRSSGKPPLLLQFAPLPAENDFSLESAAAAGIVFIADPDRHRALDTAMLGRLFGATTAEARLAALLCSGETLTSASGRLGASPQTVKAQLASLFRKTGTNRQADLIRLLVSLNS